MMKLSKHLDIHFIEATAASVAIVLPAQAGIQNIDETRMGY